jgi:hypothetical protein
MASPVLQFKRGAFTNLPGLRAGEPALTTDTFDLYVGIDSTTNNNKFFGSHRYWTKETASVGSGINLVEGTDNGSDFIQLKSPDSLSGITTYTFPATPVDNYFLKTNADGDLSWAEVISDFTIVGDTGTDTVSTGQTITFAGGEGIDTVVSDNVVTISGEAASNTNAGIASYTNSFYFIDTYQVGVVTATSSVAGIASFDSGDFTVTAGNVVLANSVDGAVLAIDGTASEVEVSRTNGTVTVGLPDNVIVGGGLTVTGELKVGTGVGITQFSGSVSTGTSTSSVPTSSAVINYVTTSIAAIDQDDDLGIAGDSGTGTVDLDTQSLTVAGTANEVTTSASGQTITVGLPDNVIVGGALTATTQLTVGTGVGITQFSSSVSTGNSTSSVPTSSAIINYINAISFDDDLGIAGDTGTGTIDLDTQSLTVAGTANEIVTVAIGQTITVGLPDSVTVTTALTTPTVNVTNVKANDGTASLTISDSTGAVTASNNLTVNGDLYVNGNTTQINTTELTVNDRTVTLGIQTGATPTTTTWDLAVLMNYGDAGVAKTAGVIWDYSVERFVFSANSDNPASESNTTTPVITVATHAPIEIASLWVNDCAGQSQVISCTGSERFLENITVDAGTF